MKVGSLEPQDFDKRLMSPSVYWQAEAMGILSGRPHPEAGKPHGKNGFHQSCIGFDPIVARVTRCM